MFQYAKVSVLYRKQFLATLEEKDPKLAANVGKLTGVFDDPQRLSSVAKHARYRERAKKMKWENYQNFLLRQAEKGNIRVRNMRESPKTDRARKRKEGVLEPSPLSKPKRRGPAEFTKRKKSQARKRGFLFE
jgi:hypothetical protein